MNPSISAKAKILRRPSAAAVLRYLRAAEECLRRQPGVPVSQLAKALRLAPSTVREALLVLRLADLAAPFQKRGRATVYRVVARREA